ncbi:sodium:solute symporter, partial [Acinetobacter baumannii]|nr:sodium:solute symporter [Acinetobacter baumannii]
FLLGALGWAAFAAAIVGPVVMSIYWHRATATAATVTVVFAIVGNHVISTLAARVIITIPAYMQVGGISLLVSNLLFYVVSLMTSNRHPDATLEHLYGGPSAATATGSGAGSATVSASSPAATSTERPDHV